TFLEIITEINQVTRGWINYFGRGFIMSYMKEIQQWLNHRVRQISLKRWKKPKTIIKQLMKLGLDIDSEKRIAYSRKKYWRLSNTQAVKRALTNKSLYTWKLIHIIQLTESAYSRY
ncbi:group II intron reverse transcriptase/maturase, partial [Staphylococcus felis]|uniref:group II intron maturase-specific domain-containing protein n=1 Tax=Staphylococcus felis TaxID=46127 RepID=UPI000E36AEC5